MADVPADLRLQIRLLSPAMSLADSSQHRRSMQPPSTSSCLQNAVNVSQGELWAWGSTGPSLGLDIHATESLLPVPSASLAIQSSHLQPIWPPRRSAMFRERTCVSLWVFRA